MAVTRERILDVALGLFAANSIAGTSLQMIADELGFTKAAVYHHFHTRDELLTALVRPALVEMRAAIDVAAAQRTPRARAERMLAEFVDLTIRHRKLAGVLGTDQSIARLLQEQGEYLDIVERPIAILGEPAPGASGRINATVALSGIASAAGGELLADVDDDVLRDRLVETGRRILGLRPPRAPGSR